MSLYILMDCSYYVFRAYHALPPLTNQQGEPTGVIFGVINMLKKVIAEYPKSKLVVVMDPKGPTFRHKKYEQYKAHRGETTEEIVLQIPLLIQIMKALGLTVMVKDGYEADDVIASLAAKAKSENHSLMILSGDKDLAQIVDDQTVLFDSLRNRKMGPLEVKDRYGVGPSFILDYLTLIGDSSDNIPGIPKVGPKTATKWLNEYGSLDKIVENKDSIKGKVGESFREHMGQLDWVKDLIRLEDSLDLALPHISCDQLKPNVEELKELYQRFGFRMWLKEFESRQEVHFDVKEVISSEDLKAFVSSFIDALTVYMLFPDDNDHSFWVYLGKSTVYVVHDLASYENSQDAIEALHQNLSKEKGVIRGYGLKGFYQHMKSKGISLKASLHDISLLAYALDSSTKTDMDSLTQSYLGEVFCDNAMGFEQKVAHQLGLLVQLFTDLEKRLNGKLKSVCYDMDVPLLPVIADMELQGVQVDAAMLMAQSHDLGSRLNVLEQKVHEKVGRVFNVQSTKQLREVLFDQMNLPVLEKTPSGVPSTSESVLSELAKQYEIAHWLTEYRQLAKLKSTYADGLTREIHAKTGRIHGSFNQTVTITGRLSSTEPNLQNIPIRTEEGRKIRDAFIAKPGCVLMAADYSQIELRIMAHFSQDANLCEAFSLDQDVHQRTASDVFSVSLEDVSQDQRRAAKAINFGLMYGMSAFGLSKQLNVSVEESKAYIDAYFARYPGVKAFMEVSRETAKKQGYVETLFGRRMALQGIQSGNRVQRQAAERAAINAPMQGTAADMIKLAMIQIDKEIKESNQPVAMILQVHDELVFELPEQLVEIWSLNIKNAMESVCQLNVPIKVDVGIGSNWNQAH